MYAIRSYYGDGNNWVDISTSSLAIHTVDLIEDTNLFYSDDRVATYIAGSSSIPNIEGTTVGDMLYWNGTTWATTSTSTLGYTLESLTDVNTIGVTGGDILYWTGSEWTYTSTSTLVADADLGDLTESTTALTITGGTGATIGNVTIDVDSDVEALATLASNGIIVRTSEGNLTTRTITAGDQTITITDGDGIADNPSIALGTVYLSNLSDVATSSLAAGDLFTYNGTDWTNVATSSLGLGDNTFLTLTDTPDAYTTGRLLFTTDSAVTDSANLVFTNGNLGIDTSSPYATLSVAGSVVAGSYTATTSTSTLNGLT